MYVAFFETKGTGYLDFYGVSKLRLEYRRAGTEFRPIYVLTHDKLAEQDECSTKFVWADKYSIGYVGKE